MGPNSTPPLPVPGGTAGSARKLRLARRRELPGLRVADPPKIIGDAIARMKERLKKQAELQQQSQ